MVSDPKKFPESGPLDPGNADWKAVMEAFKRNSFELPADPDGTASQTLLAHWDELPREGLRSLQSDAVLGPRLEQLQQAERVLESLSLPQSECPTADELYDYGRGPGYVTLTASHRRTIERHLSECDTCEAQVEMLTHSPPLPLEVASIEPPTLVQDEPDSAFDDDDHSNVFQRAQTNMRSHWMPLAAAALVLVMGFTALSRDRSQAWPDMPLLRGAAGQALSFPRGRVLASIPEATWFGFAAEPVFELQPVAGASSYRVVLTRHDGGAFAEGREIERLEAQRPVLATANALAAGNYTWQAWAIVDGLDKPLGAQDFQIVDRPELVRVVSGLKRLRGLRLLHEAGFVTDARHIARNLPPSAERDAYLNAAPGR